MIKLGRSMTALALSAALTLTSLGPGAAEALAANIQTGASKSLPGTPRVTPLPNAPFSVSPAAASGLGGTLVTLNGTIPSLGVPAIQASAGQVIAAASPILKSSAEDPGRASGKWSGVGVGSLGKLSQDAVELPELAYVALPPYAVHYGIFRDLEEKPWGAGRVLAAFWRKDFGFKSELRGLAFSSLGPLVLEAPEKAVKHALHRIDASGVTLSSAALAGEEILAVRGSPGRLAVRDAGGVSILDLKDGSTIPIDSATALGFARQCAADDLSTQRFLTGPGISK
jgi:hypothetical protein